MPPQARSEATRQKILDAATDVFGEVGFAAAGLGEVIERAGMTKGALYHHFDSKDALATAIIEQGTNLTRDAFRQVCESSSPALENTIHGVFVVTDLLVSDKTARTTEQLTRGLAQAPKATSAKASIPPWSANQSSTQCSGPSCSPRQQKTATRPRAVWRAICGAALVNGKRAGASTTFASANATYLTGF